MNNIILIFVFVIVTINSFLIGYIVGRFSGNGVYNNPQSFFDKNKQKSSIEKNTLSIDDKKFVTDIKTDDLERKYSSLGDIKTTEDTIDSSVNKLKNLKR
jgi:F420-0:gamma-glutamyl ligase-like protein